MSPVFSSSASLCCFTFLAVCLAVLPTQVVSNGMDVVDRNLYDVLTNTDLNAADKRGKIDPGWRLAGFGKRAGGSDMYDDTDNDVIEMPSRRGDGYPRMLMMGKKAKVDPSWRMAGFGKRTKIDPSWMRSAFGK